MKESLDYMSKTDMVYIMYYKKLKQKFVSKKKLKEGDDPLLVEELSCDDDWIADPSDEEYENGGEIATCG